jgi:hypothetical protein
MRDLITNDNPQTEHFEVVLRKKGATDQSATPADYKRVGVTSTGPLQAMMADDVTKEAGAEYDVLWTSPIGVATGPEILARARTLEGAPLDRSKI